MRISDWSSDVCSSDLAAALADLAWAWISAHLAHGASTRAKKLHTLALGRIRQSDLARQTAPIGERLRLGVAVPIHGIIRRHILRPLARQRADKPPIVGEVVAAIVELHALTVPRQRHIG